ncbi:Acetylcholine receptor subunit alpha-type unc-63 [Toxocara canis]|uniref:Acetylcholine receptor subunit alpha-type unc-63 n=1 Tax=Toxocara canis TaxID=6265 RepID=A0A0B2UNX1_TOXCA|nr:Acetylcholine receptor subunit alpha-type unc-63 [Toxocara canis]
MHSAANKDASRLFEDLLADYNKLVRPVDNNSETLIVRFKLKLSQLLDVHEKNQIMTTNVWLQHSWTDYKLKWNPADYGGVDILYVPSEMIWLPDIVLYNNADGNYQVTIMTKAKISSNGTVEWAPPAIYKSMCQIDVEFFPFDAQTCEMKFGSWTYGGLEVDLKHKDSHKEREELETVLGLNGEYEETVWVVDEGIDLSDYYPSVEWDILSVPGKRHEKRYPCCESPFIDLTYEIHLRRKTLFYTVNLIFPSVGISFLTALVFYLPSDGGEKISLCISILISLTVFFLLLVEIIPSTSLVIPLIGKYLLFTMVLVTLSVVVTVITLNVHYRTPTTHTMPKWVRRVFIELLPRYLLMRRPTPANIGHDLSSNSSNALVLPKKSESRLPSFSIRPPDHYASALFDQMDFLSPAYRASFSGSKSQDQGSFGSTFNKEYTPVRSAIESVTYIADHLKNEQDDNQVIEDWKYISVVMDRIFLFLFTAACAFGTVTIILRAPTIYDTTVALA